MTESQTRIPRVYSFEDTGNYIMLVSRFLNLASEISTTIDENYTYMRLTHMTVEGCSFPSFRIQYTPMTYHERTYHYIQPETSTRPISQRPETSYSAAQTPSRDQDCLPILLPS